MSGGSWSPGAAAPYGDLDERACADFFAVPPERIGAWQDRGLPRLADGRIDLFEACNWVSWNALHEAPLLARRWRWYAAWFRAWVEDGAGGGRLCWRRRHGFVRPAGARACRWYLPDPLTVVDRQRLLGRTALRSQGLRTRVLEHGQLLEGDLPQGGGSSAEGRAAIALATAREQGAYDDRQRILAVVEEFVATFRYGYRRHLPADGWSEEAGSCLDATISCGRRLAAIGRDWRLCAGLVASTRILNPHYWLEVAGSAGTWIPVDPSLAAIARMLGLDWRRWARAYVGGFDGRRLLLSCAPLGEDPSREVLGPDAAGFVSSVPGALLLSDAGGSWRDAWPCLDWVCGETLGDIAWS